MKNKQFDCVKMKNEIQQERYKRRKDMTHQEEIADMENVLKNSKSMLAEWWRSVEKKTVSNMPNLLR